MMSMKKFRERLRSICRKNIPMKHTEIYGLIFWCGKRINIDFFLSTGSIAFRRPLLISAALIGCLSRGAVPKAGTVASIERRRAQGQVWGCIKDTAEFERYAFCTNFRSQNEITAAFLGKSPSIKLIYTYSSFFRSCTKHNFHLVFILHFLLSLCNRLWDFFRT